MTRPGGAYAFAISVSLLAWGLALLIATSAFGYSDSDYCRDVIAAERLACHAQHLADVADCGWTRAVERWLGVADANRNATECRNEAAEECRACKIEAAECAVTP